jgi:hypothetical protein
VRPRKNAAAFFLMVALECVSGKYVYFESTCYEAKDGVGGERLNCFCLVILDPRKFPLGVGQGLES